LSGSWQEPKFVKYLLTGAVRGLLPLLPAAGYVTLPDAVIIGIASSLLCYLAVNMKNKIGWDALDGAYMASEASSSYFAGVFATKAVNPGGAQGKLMTGKQVSMKGDCRT
jgi:Amt family ammonium transporter